MKSIHKILLITFILFIYSSYAYSQLTINNKAIVYDKLSNTYIISIPEEAFGKDYHTTIELDTTDVVWDSICINGQSIQNEYTFEDVEANKVYEIQANNGQGTINTKLTFTFLPIISMIGNFGYDYANGNINIYTPENTIPQYAIMKAKWRGGSTNAIDRHKRNYKIKTLNENGENKDISFLGMRKDNNWILDAGQVDMFRMRNRIATELWNDFATKPYYADKEPKAKTGVNGKVVELILNDEYKGIYSLTEIIDRKELKLKKYNDEKQEIHGQLWKASGYGYATFWDKPEAYDNECENWNVFETKYPDIKDVYPTDYSVLYNAINFVSNSNDETFKREVDEYFDIPVLIDYQIFTELVKAIDNCGKNIYWTVYDKADDKKLTLAVWDLDATVGQNWQCSTPLHPEYLSPYTELGIKNSFNIYYRLSSLDVNNYNQKVAQRYNSLRNTYLSKESLINRYQSYFDMITKSGAAQREIARWSGDSDIGGYTLDFDKEIEYIKDWVTNRLIFLDSTNSPLITNIKSNTYNKTKNNRIFNIAGQEVNSNYKGLKIINGKKYCK